MVYLVEGGGGGLNGRTPVQVQPVGLSTDVLALAIGSAILVVFIVAALTCYIACWLRRPREARPAGDLSLVQSEKERRSARVRVFAVANALHGRMIMACWAVLALNQPGCVCVNAG